MSLFRATSAPDPVVSLSELKSFLKIENDIEDKMLKRLILTAQNAVERTINRTILATVVESTFTTQQAGDYTLTVEQTPLMDVSIKAENSFGAAIYPAVSWNNRTGAVTVSKLALGDKVTVSANVGLYTDVDLVDGLLTQAIMTLVSYWYEARDAADIPPAVLSMCRPFKFYGV